MSHLEKTRYLKSYIDGTVKDVVEDQLSNYTDESYRDARFKLKDRFGRRLEVTRAIREKLVKFHSIRKEDAAGVQRFADYLENL